MSLDPVVGIKRSDLDRLTAEANHAVTECRRMHRLLHNIGPCPECKEDEAYGVTNLAPSRQAMVFRCDCGYAAPSSLWPPHPAYAIVMRLGNKEPAP